MKSFLQLDFNPSICRAELAELKQLLESKRGLSERDVSMAAAKPASEF